ncbi:myelin-associated glycoprotein [Oreochromis niloticus]|nr:myelin-associated glycoprotein [Oreochromis niloticus]CAI5662717.1 unnamed protein product [Mustela putorius furo]
MKLKLCLSFLMFFVIHDVQSAKSQWMALVPSTIPAVQGSCVVIPCTYNYPRPSSKKIINSWLGFWKKGNKVLATSIQKWKLPVEYKKRTQFLAKLRTRNCTMLLDSVRSTDVGPFYFRIEMPQYKSFSYTQNSVSIDVIRNPPPPTLSVEVNDQVYATCSVFHSCPSIPPQFSWSHTGVIKSQSKKVNAWNWQTVSTLTFPPLATDFNKPLNCTVRHRGGKEAQSSIILLI